MDRRGGFMSSYAQTSEWHGLNFLLYGAHSLQLVFHIGVTLKSALILMRGMRRRSQGARGMKDHRKG